VAILILLFCLNAVDAQTLTDSIVKMYMHEHDTVKAAKYIECAAIIQNKDYANCIKLCDAAIKLAQENNQPFLVADATFLKGLTSYFAGEYDATLNYYLTAIRQFDHLHKNTAQAKVYNELGFFYRMQKNDTAALNSFKEAYRLAMADHNEAVMATAVNNQGVWAQDRGDHQTALQLFNQAQTLYIKLGDSIGVSYTMDYSAVSYAAQKKYLLATELQTESYYIRLRQKDTNAASLSVFSLAEIAQEEGKQLQAKNYLLQCLAISERIKYKELSLQCYKKLAEICSNTGDAQSAYNYHVRYANLNEEIFNEKRSKQISELQTKYETDKRMQQITILTKDMELKDNRHRIQRNLFVSALLLILIAVIAFYFFYRGKKQREKDQAIIFEKEQRSKAIIETEEKERIRIARDLHDGIAQTMTAAKMQLEHFMEESGKTLQIPDSLKYAYDLVVDSAKEVRTISHSMIPNALIKSGLVAAVRDFVNRMGNEKLKINLIVLGLEERFNSNAETVIFRVLQELVSNIIKHAQANEITIQLIKENHDFTLMVEDNGKGFDPEKAAVQDGIGLKNIRSRVEYLNGSVSFDSAPGKGTTIVVEIPV